VLRSGANVNEMRELALESGMTTLREEGLLLATEGLTTVTEVLANTPNVMNR
jgi:type II secretory ATPase GspE/PulE/Tfp pilus assembly ATPase PilB-like protein